MKYLQYWFQAINSYLGLVNRSSVLAGTCLLGSMLQELLFAIPCKTDGVLSRLRAWQDLLAPPPF
jgi:hypothetical protein